MLFFLSLAIENYKFSNDVVTFEFFKTMKNLEKYLPNKLLYDLNENITNMNIDSMPLSHLKLLKLLQSFFKSETIFKSIFDKYFKILSLSYPVIFDFLPNFVQLVSIGEFLSLETSSDSFISVYSIKRTKSPLSLNFLNELLIANASRFRERITVEDVISQFNYTRRKIIKLITKFFERHHKKNLNYIIYQSRRSSFIKRDYVKDIKDGDHRRRFSANEMIWFYTCVKVPIFLDKPPIKPLKTIFDG